jgi:predicted nucleic acid-binding protein
MTGILVDSNVLLDILTEDTKWFGWSRTALAQQGNNQQLIINAVIYAEVSVNFDSIKEADEALPERLFRREPIPFEAAFLAGKIYLAYRRRGGQRIAPLPDFFIGAHAAVSGYSLITRDPRRYRREFPTLNLITP